MARSRAATEMPTASAIEIAWNPAGTAGLEDTDSAFPSGT